MADDDDFSFDSLNHIFALLSFENTASLLGEATFRTHLVPLTREAAVELLQFSRLVQSGDGSVSISMLLSQSPILSQLCALLDEAIQVHFAGCPGVFAKMADFSPKDAVGECLEDPQFLETYRQKLAFLKASLHDTPCNNLSLQALLWAKAGRLHQQSGCDILTTFVRSQRVIDELERKLELVAEYIPTHITLREWIDLDPAYEFRGFSVHNTLVALSQMATLGIGPPAYPQLASQREALFASAQAFYQQTLSPRLSDLAKQLHGLFVCDLYYHVPAARWYVIELNPWETSAAGHLFTKDMATLRNTLRPFGLRLVSETAPSLLTDSTFPQSWVPVIQASEDTWFLF